MRIIKFQRQTLLNRGNLPGQIFQLAQSANWLGLGIDLVIDGGVVGNEPSTVIDWHDESLRIIREGAGDISFLL